MRTSRSLPETDLGGRPGGPPAERRAARIEPMEARLLLSGDPGPALAAGALTSLDWNGLSVQAAAAEWVVQLADPSPDLGAVADSLAGAGFGGFDLQALGGGGFALLTAPQAGADALSAWADATGTVESIEPNFALSLDDTALLGRPDDDAFSSQWALHNTGQSRGTPDADIDAPEAWDVTTGSAGVVVGVIDTGIDITHPDLVGNLWTNPGEIAGDGIDNDGNGYVDDLHGWDFVDNDAAPTDRNGHGTHVAGTIGAVGDNAQGVAGVSWDVQLMALRFLGADGSGYVSDAIEAVDYATTMRTRYGVNVVATNNSWGGGGYSAALRAAIARAGQAGILFVAAAGNGGYDGVGDNTDRQASYPAGYDLSNVISVAATDRNDDLASFSNYGSRTVDLAAPGVSILSTLPNGRYGTYSGTSMATPHVTGVVALLAAQDPGASAGELKAAVLDGADPLAELAGRTVSGGRLNAYGALLRLGGDPLPDPDPTPDPDPPTPEPGPHEPNDSLAQADRSEAAEATALTWEGTVGDGAYGAADVDLFGLRVGAGATVTVDIDAHGIGTGLDPVLRLFNAAGRELAYNDDTHGLDSYLQLALPGAGDYYVGVSGYRNGRYDPAAAGSGSSGSQGDYRLRAAVTYTAPSDPADPTDPADPDDPADPADPTDPSDGEHDVGPDAFGYVADAVDYTFEDIASDGTAGLRWLADDEAFVLGPNDLDGFTFRFYGQAYDRVYVSSNGLITFGAAETAYENTPLTAGPSLAAVAAYWDDLVVSGRRNAGVYWAVRGAGDEQRLVLQWQRVRPYGSWGRGTATFQAVLYEADGAIRLNYEDLDVGAGSNGASATVGIKDAGGQAAGGNVLAISHDRADGPLVRSGVSTRISLSAPAPAEPDPVDAPAAPTPTEIAFDRTAPATFTDADGGRVTVRLAGAGSGVVHLPDADGVHAERIVLADTEARSVLTISVSGGAGETVVGGIDVDGPLARLTARTTDLVGDLTVSGGVGNLRLDDVTGATLTLGAIDRAVRIRMDQVADTRLLAGSRITSLHAAEWLDLDGVADTIETTSAGSLRITGRNRDGIDGDFDADLVATDAEGRFGVRSVYVRGASRGDWDVAGRLGLANVRGDAFGTWTLGGAGALRVGGDAAGDWSIGGDVRIIHVGGDATGDWTLDGDVVGIRVRGEATGQWEITGDVRWVRIGESAAEFSAHVGGDVRSLRADGDLSGRWSSRTLGNLTVRGNLIDAAVLLRAEPAGRARTLGRATVRGWIENAVIRSAGDVGFVTAGGVRDASVFAGVRTAVSALPDAEQDFDALASIRSIRVTGRVRDAAGQSVTGGNFAAASIGSLRLANVAVGGGAAALGLATQSLGSFHATHGRTRYRWTARGNQPLPDLPASWELRLPDLPG